MPIDPRIALGIEPLNVESPVSMMTNIMQLRNAQKQAELQQQAQHKAQIEEGIKTISGYGNKADAITGLYEAFESDKIDKPHFDRMLSIMKSNPDWDTAKEQILMPLLSAKDQLDLQTQLKQKQRLQEILNPSATAAPAAPVDQEQALFNQLNPQPAAPAAAPTNALVSQTPAQTQSDNVLRQLLIEGTPQALAIAKQIESENKLNEPNWVERSDNQNKWYEDTNPRSSSFGQTRSKIEMKATPGQELTNARLTTVREKNYPLLAQLVAEGNLDPMKINSRNAPVLENLMRNNPNINPVDLSREIALSTSTQKAFTSGVESRNVRANNVAINHLSSMDKWSRDLNNSDLKIRNRAAQFFAKETGSAAPVSFDAARQIVGAEVVKAIVQNGGTGTERDEAANAFSTANSPKALADVISKYRILLGGQLEGLQNQYEAGTGETDFQDKFLLPETRKWIPKKAGADAGTPPAADKTQKRVTTSNW